MLYIDTNTNTIGAINGLTTKQIHFKCALNVSDFVRMLFQGKENRYQSSFSNTTQFLHYQAVSTLPISFSITTQFLHYQAVSPLPRSSSITKQFLHYQAVSPLPSSFSITNQFLHY